MWYKLLDFFRTTNFTVREHPSELRRVINGVGFYLCLFGISFYYFHKFLQVFLKRTSSLRRYQRNQFAHLSFNLMFHVSTTVFLITKHTLTQAAQANATERMFAYDSFLFHRACESDLFRTVSVILMSFYLLNLIFDIFESNVLGFVMKLLYIGVLAYCLKSRLENFAVTLNIRLSAFYVLAKLVSLLALASNPKKRIWGRFLAILKLCSWSYCYLNVVPMLFLLPAIQSPHNTCRWLVVILGLWYSSTIWNSPVLKYFYHQLYHVPGNDCVGRDSASRCILLRDSEERRHMLLLQESVMKVNLVFKKHNSRMSPMDLNADPADSSNQSAKAYQTIKCMMTLKRKLKNLRQEQEHFKERVMTGQHSKQLT